MKKKIIGVIIAWLFGWAGGYRFYKKQKGWGFIYLFTCGLFGIGWIYDIVCSIISLFKNEPDISEPANDIQPPAPRKIRYHHKLRVKGVTYACKLDSGTKRQYVLQKTYKGDKFHLQEFKYKGEPAFLIVSDKLNLDIGTVPATLVDRIKQYEDSEFETDIILENIDWFEPEGKDDIVIYAEMLYVVYSDKATSVE